MTYKQYNNGSSLLLPTKEHPCVHIGDTQSAKSYKHTQNERPLQKGNKTL
jgi:hypothetical protein